MLNKLLKNPYQNRFFPTKVFPNKDFSQQRFSVSSFPKRTKELFERIKFLNIIIGFKYILCNIY